MKRVLITGILGFVGSYAIEKFHNEGWKIHGIDNHSTNAIQKDVRISRMFNMDCVEFVQSDFDYDGKIDKYDLILHLASIVGPSGVLKWAGDMGEEIVKGVQWAKNIALENDCPLVFISTSEIYGHRPSAVRLPEDDYKILVGDYSVRNEYAMAKLLAEVMIVNTAKVKPLKYRIIRPFNISGARQQPDGGFVLPRFVKQALKNEPITVFGDGRDIRSFTHCEDIVSGIFLLANQSENGIWNVGTPNNKTSILELAKMVVKISGSKSEIKLVDPKTIYGPTFEGAWDKICDDTKITKAGWSPKWDIDGIICDVINYWRSK